MLDLRDTFVLSGETSYEKFLASVRASQINIGSVSSIEWAPLVAATDLPLLSAHLQTQGLPALTVTTGAGPNRIAAAAIENASVQPVIYVDPFEPNRRVYGFNILSGLNRPHVERSRDLGTIVMSRLTVLIRSAEQEQLGFALYVPVFAGEIENHRFLGHIVSVVELGEFAQKVADDVAPHDADVLIVDRTGSGAEGPFVTWNTAGRVSLRALPSISEFSDPFTRAVSITHWQRDWQILVRPSTSWLEERKTSRPARVLVVGLALSLLGSALMYRNNRTQSKDTSA